MNLKSIEPEPENVKNSLKLENLEINNEEIFLDPVFPKVEVCLNLDNGSTDIEMSKLEPSKPKIDLEKYFDSIIDSYIDEETEIKLSTKKTKSDKSFKLNCIDNETRFNDFIEFSSYIEANISKQGDYFIYKLKKDTETVEFHMRKISDIVGTIYKYHIIRNN